MDHVHPPDGSQGESILGFFYRLFTLDFMPHGHCYFWRADIIWLHVLSNAAIAIAYFSIPIMLYVFIRRRKDLPFHWMFGMFATFIFLCGTTHIMDIVTLWIPLYRLDGVIRACTGAVSIATAICLVPLIPKALALRGPGELEEKNARLEEAYAQIKEVERQKDEFLSKVSHELRTPLTLMLAPLEILLSGRAGGFSDEQSRILRTIHNNTLRLLQMITGLLDFSKLQANKTQVRREASEASSLTEALLSDFRPLAQQKAIHLTAILEKPMRRVELDRYLYERILFNLLSNAIKFTPRDGSVEVRLVQTGDRLTLSVTDNGIGIAAADIPRLFRRFHQLDQPSARRFEGTGLGLSLVKEFAELLGGRVSVESEPGKGSTFTVELRAPLAGDAVAENARSTDALLAGEAEAVVDSLGGKLAGTWAPKVLIAEDNAELSHYVATLLAPMCRVQTASDGIEALKLAETWPADLVLSDVMMPGMDGITLTQKLKENTRTSNIPVVLLTALTDRESLLNGWKAGAAEYLFKPFHPAELITRIKSMLTIVEQRRSNESALQRRNELEQFAYFASHDLREPLRTLTQMSQLLVRSHSSELGPDARDYLGFIAEAAARMQNIIDDLVKYSLVDASPPVIESVNTAVVVQEALRALDKEVQLSGARLTIGNLPEVRANHAQMVQLFEALLGNAMKFRRADSLTIEVSAEAMPDDWIFTVRDNGVGFEQRYADRIFVVFRRLHARKEYPGTGIGLAIAKRIVERWNGRIWAEGEAGKGSVFRFTVPRAPVVS